MLHTTHVPVPAETSHAPTTDYENYERAREDAIKSLQKKPVAVDVAYDRVYNDAFKSIKLATDHVAKVASKHGEEFSTNVGCCPKVMALIEKLYEEAHTEHDNAIRSLDDKFKTIVDNRNAYIMKMLANKAESDKRAKDMKDALDNFNALTSSKGARLLKKYETMIATELATDIRVETANSDDVRNTLRAWFGKREDTEMDTELYTLKPQSTLPDGIKTEITAALAKK